MDNFPEPVKQFLYEHFVGKKPIALLILDLEGLLVSQFGNLEPLGIGDLKIDEVAEEQLDFLSGMIELDAMPLDIPFLEMPSGMSTDIHILNKDGQIWVLMIGVEDKSAWQKIVQQRSNGMSLSHQHQSQILNQYLGKEVARRLEIGMDNISAKGERRSLTMMFADIRGFTTFSEKAEPGEVFGALNIYLQAMIPAVIEEHGVIDKIIGDEIMAIFGMLPDDSNGPCNGVRAAIRMLQAIEKLNQIRARKNRTLLQIGIGMATGPVSLGILGSQHRKSITVIGNHVNLASRLQGLAAPGQLLIDRSTMELVSNDFNDHFSQKEYEIKGYSAPVEAYSFELGGDTQSLTT